MCFHAKNKNKKKEKSKPAITLIGSCDRVIKSLCIGSVPLPGVSRLLVSPVLWWGSRGEREKSNSRFCAANAFLSQQLATSIRAELLIRSAVLPMAVFTANVLRLYII